MYKRLFILGVEKSKDGIIKTIKVLDESMLEVELAKVPNCIGCKLSASRGMLKVLTLKSLVELVSSGKVVISNAEIAKEGYLKLLDGFRVTEIITDSYKKAVSNDGLLQLIYKTTIPVVYYNNDKRFESNRKVVVGCTVDGDIKVLDYTEYKPPELLSEQVVNCKCTINNNKTISVRRNNGDLRESEFHLSNVLMVSETPKGVIFIDKKGAYSFLDSESLSVSKSSNNICLDWLLGIDSINGVKVANSRGMVENLLYRCKGNRLVSRLGVTKSSRKGNSNLNITDKAKLQKDFKKLYTVPPLFDIVDGRNTKGLEVEECIKHFDCIPDVNIVCIRLSRGSQFTKQYGIPYIGTVYIQSTGKLLDLKYFGMRWHKTSSGKSVINAFYKGFSKKGRIANFMDIIDISNGEVLNSVELDENLIDAVIDSYAKNIANNTRLNNRVGSNLKDLLGYKEFLKRLCKIDNELS